MSTIPNIAAEAVLVQSQPMPEDSRTVKGEYIKVTYNHYTLGFGEMLSDLEIS